MAFDLLLYLSQKTENAKPSFDLGSFFDFHGKWKTEN
jgi:hypothetical protein